MEPIKILVLASLISCFALMPIAIFLTKPTSPKWLLRLKILGPITLFTLTISYTSMSTCFEHNGWSCLSYMTFVFIGMLQYITYIGWFEYFWRRIHKQIKWPLRNNLQYGVISNIVILISAVITPLAFLAISPRLINAILG